MTNTNIDTTPTRTVNQEIGKWFQDNGDKTHILNYDLNENSIVMDLGGYTGVWIEGVINKFNCNTYVIEPIEEFYNVMVEKFKNNNKTHLRKVGVGDENTSGTIYLHGDETTTHTKNGGESVNVEFRTMDNILNEWNLTDVDLLQINIEGEEYPLLEYMLKHDLVKYFKNIQIQFHYIGMSGDVIDRREKIQQGLVDNGFTQSYNYEFVWESWKRGE